MPNFTWPPGLQESQIVSIIKAVINQEVPSMLATSAFLLDGGNSPLVNASFLGNGVTLTAQSYEPLLSFTRTVPDGISATDLIGKVVFSGLASGDNFTTAAESAKILCTAIAEKVPGRGIPSKLGLYCTDTGGFSKERITLNSDASVNINSEIFRVNNKEGGEPTFLSVDQNFQGKVTLGAQGWTPTHEINGDEQAAGAHSLSMDNAPAAGVVRYLKVKINGINAVIPFLPR